MRVSILTQPLGHNYGGLLQAYALQSYLMKCECKVETLDFRMPKDTFRKRVRNISVGLIKILLGKAKSLPTKEKKDLVYKALHHFKDENIGLSPKLESLEEVEEYYRNSSFDVLLVGSDQVWRPKYSPAISAFFLGFANTLNLSSRRASYAASFGVDVWEYSLSETVECSHLLKQFDAISVREASAVDMCRVKLGVVPELVVDPTMLLDAVDYAPLFDKVDDFTASGKVLNYVLDQSMKIQDVVSKTGDLLGLEMLSIKPRNTISQVPLSKISTCIYKPVEEWLKAFSTAEFVVTDSFHGCVFSIIFNKPFVAVGNVERGVTRFQSLLGMVGLGSRLVSSVEEVDEALVGEVINWSEVNAKVDALREKSGNYLLRNVLNYASIDSDFG